MKETFLKMWPLLAASEGGYANDPKDPGGETMRGITKRVYDAWLLSQGSLPKPVRDITAAEVTAIAKVQYWDAVRADDLPEGIDYLIFDCAFMHGPNPAVKFAQRILGVTPDGVMGAVTLNAINEYTYKRSFIRAYSDARLAYLKTRKHWPRYKNGWTDRVWSVCRTAMKMWDGDERAIEPPPPAAKAPAQMASVTSGSTGKATLMSGASALASATLEAANSIQPLGDIGMSFKYLFAGLTVLSVALTLFITVRRYQTEGVA